MPVHPIRTALDLIRNDGFKMGKGWEAAHEIAQGNEGEPMHDWLHALVHLIEGDEFNAGYWFRRAGKPVVDNPSELADAIEAAL